MAAKRPFRVWRQLVWNRIRFNVQVRREGWRIKLILPVILRRPIRLAGLSLGAMGAFGVFGSRLVGPAIWLVTLLLDRFVFFYVVPLFPQTFFEFDPDKHGGVGFGGMEFDTGQGTTEAPVVSPVFTDREYARRLFEWMLSWNAGEANDAEEGNIAASLVLESDSYFLCCYPSIGRGRVKRFLEGVHDTQLKEGDPMLEQGRIVVMCPLILRADVSRDSFLPTFLRRYPAGCPFVLAFTAKGEDGLEVVGKLILKDLEVKNRDSLTRRDLEYDLLRLFYPEDFDPRCVRELPETEVFSRP